MGVGQWGQCPLTPPPPPTPTAYECMQDGLVKREAKIRGHPALAEGSHLSRLEPLVSFYREARLVLVRGILPDGAGNNDGLPGSVSQAFLTQNSPEILISS